MSSILPVTRRAVIAALVLAPTLPAGAAGVTKDDAKKIRRIIEAQLAAFAKDDAARAFSYAAPGIKQMFGTPERFIDMVRQGYPVVYRPASVSFLAPEGLDGTVIQAVEMTDASGAAWVAVYRLEKQRDGQWRIAGCELTAGQGAGT